MRKFISILIFMFILTGCSSNKTSELTDVTLMLDYTPNTNHTGIYVAETLGYYKDEGINLNIIQPSENTTEMAVASNQAEFGISYQENLLMAKDNDMNLISIYAILSHNTSGLMSMSDKQITSAKDLEGKTYCGWGSDVERAIISEVASQNGIDPNSITYKTISTNFLNTNSDECDFFWEYESWSGVKASMENIDYNYISFLDNGIDEYTPIIITSQSLIDENPELVQNFINATIKGYEYAYNNPKESAEIFVSENPEFNIDFIEQSQNMITQYYVNADNNKFGYHESDIWNDFMKLLFENNIITKEYNEAFTNEFINNYYESNN